MYSILLECMNGELEPASPVVLANQKLLNAAIEGDLKAVQVALEEGADVNATDRNGNTPLILALWRRSNPIARLLIERGTDVNHTNNLGWDALQWAVKQNNPEIVRMLLLHNTRMTENRKGVLNFLQTYNVSPLSLAIIDGNRKDITQVLASLPQENIDAQDNFGMTALHWAAARNDEQTVNELLKRNADVNIRDNDGNTPLHYAARNGYLHIVRALLAHNAQVNLFNDHNESAWILALRNNHPEVVNLLERYAGPAVFGLVTRAGQVGELANLPGDITLPAEIAALVAQYAMAPGAQVPSGHSA